MSLITLFGGTAHPVNMEVFLPPSTVTVSGKSVVVAYGTDGMSPASKPMIESFCQNLAKAGHVVVLPSYFEMTNTTPGLSTVSNALTSTNLAKWTDALNEAVNWCKSNQAGTKVFLIGFSLGGYMAARCAIATNAHGFVDFFGPMTTFGQIPFPPGEEFDSAKASKLPQTQIHHGTRDFVVLPSESKTLEKWLNTAGVRCDLYPYPCGHPQQPEGKPWTVAEQTQATPVVLTFLS